jgi:5-methylcytosine-specific restriction endonuclease McrA
MRKDTREYIIQRDKGRCRYCGEKPEPRWRWMGWDNGHWRTGLEIDHIVPRSKGGTDHPANLVLACEECNLKKYDNVWTPLPVPAA